MDEDSKEDKSRKSLYVYQHVAQTAIFPGILTDIEVYRPLLVDADRWRFVSSV